MTRSQVGESNILLCKDELLEMSRLLNANHLVVTMQWKTVRSKISLELFAAGSVSLRQTIKKMNCVKSSIVFPDLILKFQVLHSKHLQ